MQVTTHTSDEQQVALNLWVLLPIVNGNLGQSNWADGVDRESLVLADLSIFRVLSEGRNARGVPEGACWWLVHSSTVDHYIDSAELLKSRLP